MISTEFEHDLKASVRSIPDYPKPGIMFRDITTLLGDARAFRRASAATSLSSHLMWSSASARRRSASWMTP